MLNRTHQVAAILSTIATILTMGLAFESRDVAKYRNAEGERIARVQKIVSEHEMVGSNGAIPFVNVQGMGPNLLVEAGFNLKLDADIAKDSSNSSVRLVAKISDYPPGEFLINEAENAVPLIHAIRQVAAEFVADVPNGESISVEAIGVADGLTVKESAVYRGELDVIRGEEYYSIDVGQKKIANLLPGSTKLTNELIAFLRAFDVLNCSAQLFCPNF